MMLIKEKDNKLSNYISPSFTILALLSSTSLFALSIALMNGFFGFLPNNEKLYSLSLNFLADIAAVIFIFTIIMPLVEAGRIRYKKVSLTNTIKMFALFCLTYLAILAFQIIFLELLDIIYPVPSENPYTSISPVGDEVFDPLHIVLFLAVLVIAAPIYEELAFRRVLIPMLEKRGMSPIGAVFASSLVFASAHTPNDLINGNLRFAIEHFFPILILGITMGILYVTTRNVIYPMLVHAMFNGISGVGTVANELYIQNADIVLISIVDLVILIILFLGIVALGYMIYKIVSKQRLDWFDGLVTKSSNRFIPGFIGFISIFWVLVTLETVLTNLSITDPILRLLILLGVESVLFFGSMWIITNSEYKGEGGEREYLKSIDSTAEKTNGVTTSPAIECQNCGTLNKKVASYCKNCGTKINP